MSYHLAGLKPLLATLALLIVLPVMACGVSVQQSQQQIDDANEAARSNEPESNEDRPQKISVFDLRTGDCYNEPDLLATDEGESLELNRVELVSCDGPHDFEVLQLVFVDHEKGAPYPGEAYFDDLFISECPLEANYLIFPVEESWELGDRVLNCLQATE